MPPIYRALNNRHPFDLCLYLVANRPSFKDESLFIAKILAAVKGGVSCVQLRDHEGSLENTIKTAVRLKHLIKSVPLFINTLHSIEVVQAVQADGIYIEDSLSFLDVRKRLGKKAIIGISVKTIQEVETLEKINAIDYLSVKISPSKRTCSRNDWLWGIDGLRRVRAMTPHRIVAIGGLNVSSVANIYPELHLDDGIAMAGGLMDEENPYYTAQKILSIRQKIMSKKS